MAARAVARPGSSPDPRPRTVRKHQATTVSTSTVVANRAKPFIDSTDLRRAETISVPLCESCGAGLGILVTTLNLGQQPFSLLQVAE
jgi:hypothetical protein